MKKLYSMLIAATCVLASGLPARAESSEYDVEFQFTGSTKADYFKDWGNGITTSSDRSISSSSKEYYVSLGSTPSNANSNYVEISATQEIASVEFFVTGNSTDKVLGPPILGWKQEVSAASADYVKVLDPTVTSENKGASYAQWISYDLSDANLKIVRFYRSVKGVAVGSYDTKTNIGANTNTIQLYGLRVKLKSNRTEIDRSTEITGVTIDGTAISAENLTTLKNDYSLTLADTYIAAPAVAFATTTTITYDTEEVEYQNNMVNAEVVEGAGNTFVATATVNEHEYTITVNKNVEPALTATPASVELQSLKNGVATATITVVGANLTGDEVTITLPDIEGLTSDKTTLAIVDGSVNDSFTISYVSAEDIAETVANVALSAGAMTVNMAVTYSSTAPLTAVVPITGSTTWNWTGATASDILLTDDKDKDVFLGNYDGWAAGFNADALMGNGQYLSRPSNKCFQGNYVKFVTEVDGIVTISFSNTNTVEKNGLRTLQLNEEDTEFTANKGATAVTAVLRVKAGDVKLGGCQTTQGSGTKEEDLGKQAYLRIYEINFVAVTGYITVGWQNKEHNWTAPHVKYSVDNGASYVVEPMALYDPGDAAAEFVAYAVAAGETRWVAQIPSNATNLTFVGTDDEETIEYTGSEIGDQKLYDGTDKISGVDAVDVDSQDVVPVYYNLQGMRVAEPTMGTYIVVRGSKVTKEVIR